VLELGTLKLRMQQSREAKARRGELGRMLAPGYVMDADQRIVKDPNLRVQQAMAMVFSRFDVLGSIRQTHRWFHDERSELPVNKAVHGRFELRWQLPTTGFIKDVLSNPLYAGAYVHGRRPIKVIIKDGQTIKRQRSAQAAENASIFITDHHEGTIDWQTYQRPGPVALRRAWAGVRQPSKEAGVCERRLYVSAREVAVSSRPGDHCGASSMYRPDRARSARHAERTDER